MSYLTEEEAEARLDERYGIAAAPLIGDLEIASSELDSLGPFIGTQLVTDGTQTLAFPRSENPDGTTNAQTDPPDAILDWVALNAYRISVDDPPAITSRSARGLSESYAYPKGSQNERRMAYLLAPYFLRMGQSVDTRPYSPTPEADLAR